jgi:predicted ABC-class ATPase
LNKAKDLMNMLSTIDGKGYKSYKLLEGEYMFEKYTLCIDHVQPDPYAPPSKLRMVVPQSYANFPKYLIDKQCKKVGVIDFLTRNFQYNIARFCPKYLFIDRCGQEILYRTSVYIDEQRVEVRFEMGMPAAGRRILGEKAKQIFFKYLPDIMQSSLVYKNIDSEALKRQINLMEDNEVLRDELQRLGLCAFIANGSILPRESGTSDKPLPINKGAKPFKSPKSLEVSIKLPHKGRISGMGIPKGITLIVGGGYHGKSTLLKALEKCIYPHIEGDGREYVVSLDSAVKIRSEDGRRIHNTDISPFINNLPNGVDTRKFCTQNASGSTSQAANIMEALEAGAKLLLIDEDTSATNFMVRDAKMKKLISPDKEPITPFIDKVRSLYVQHDISTILVIGGVGDYFDVADNVIMMDEYIPRNVTDEAKKIANDKDISINIQAVNTFGQLPNRVLCNQSECLKKCDIRTKGLNTMTYNKDKIDLSHVEQLIDSSQTNCIAMLVRYILVNIADDHKTLSEALDVAYDIIKKRGLDNISPYKGNPGRMALPRKYEVAAALNRWPDRIFY